jgi:hypothetical protein
MESLQMSAKKRVIERRQAKEFCWNFQRYRQHATEVKIPTRIVRGRTGAML